MPKEKKENSVKDKINDERPRPGDERNRKDKSEEFDISIISRIASQISDDGSRQERRKTNGN